MGELFLSEEILAFKQLPWGRREVTSRQPNGVVHKSAMFGPVVISRRTRTEGGYTDHRNIFTMPLTIGHIQDGKFTPQFVLR